MGTLSEPFVPYAEAIAVKLLGSPTYRSPHQLRWGKKGSFSVTTAGSQAGRFHDFETGQGGDILDLVRHKLELSPPDALAWLRSATGASAPAAAVTPPPASSTRPQVWSRRAQVIWDASMPLAGTLGETYLRSRSCFVPGASDIRFLPGGTHPPAIVARVTDFETGQPTTLSFIRLDPDTGWKAEGPGSKVCLAGHRKSGGVVRLSRVVETGGRLGIAEGIETALSIIATGNGPVWAALGADTMRQLAPSSKYGELLIWADNDQAGHEAASHLARSWITDGHNVRIVVPPEQGKDWNDVVMADAQEARR